MIDKQLNHLEAFQIVDPSTGDKLWGADQDWYLSSDFHRKAGCGPTTVTNIMAYFSQTKESQRALWDEEDYSFRSYQKMMEKIWEYVTPGKMGLYSISVLANGAVAYAKSRGITLTAEEIDLAALERIGKSFSDVENFIIRALDAQSPVAFVNYSNGREDRLDSWHWVTLAGIRKEEASTWVLMIDNNYSKEIDLELWYKTSFLGGGLVSFRE